MGLRGALGSTYPGADMYLSGAVPAGTVVSVHGSHLRKRATRVKQRRRPSGSILTCRHAPRNAAGRGGERGLPLTTMKEVDQG
jgi:hypothetical protein